MVRFSTHRFFFANVMDLVDGVDAAPAGDGDGVSLDSILEVLAFSGGSSSFRPRAELRAGMLALHLRLQWSKIKFQFRGMWVVYSVNFDGCQSICRDALLCGSYGQVEMPTNP
jgi:hypothetical protein